MVFWPFWLGGLALGAVAVGFAALAGRGLGVSGALSAVIDRDAFNEERALLNKEALDARLAAETEALLASLPAEQRQELEAAAQAAQASDRPNVAPRLSWSSYMLFLGSMVVGGFVGGNGGIKANVDLDPTQVRLFGEGPAAYALLFVGGILVGAGTKLAGGCTSGHGLVGIARLQAASLAATATFFGTAIVVSLAIEFVQRGAW